MGMKRTAILQIGTEKTGTTTLQTFLAANRERLAARGYCYPRFCGEINHTGLAAFAMEAERMDPLRRAFGVHVPNDVAGMRQRLSEAAEAELANGSLAIFCSEHCHSRLISKGEVERLRAFLSQFFDEIRISVYLRRQDHLALSLYSTMLKSGGIPKKLLPDPLAEDPYYNYDRFLALWEDVFGPKNVSVRLFERDALVGGSVVSDFLSTSSLGALSEFVSVPNENGSISATAQEFLRLVNPYLVGPKDAPSDALRGPIVAALSRFAPGPGAKPDRSAARAFYETYRASNSAVAARHFPDRDTLFDENFDTYSANGDDCSADPQDFGKLTAALLIEQRNEIDRLEAEIAIREAALHWRDDRPEAAVAKLQSALSRFPGHAGLHRSLGEYLLRLDQPKESLLSARRACGLSPDHWEFQHFLGIVLAANGEAGCAVDAQRRALQLNPGYQGAEAALARAMAATGAGSENQGQINPVSNH
jgi:hypothetical protein